MDDYNQIRMKHVAQKEKKNKDSASNEACNGGVGTSPTSNLESSRADHSSLEASPVSEASNMDPATPVQETALRYEGKAEVSPSAFCSRTDGHQAREFGSPAGNRGPKNLFDVQGNFNHANNQVDKMEEELKVEKGKVAELEKQIEDLQQRLRTQEARQEFCRKDADSVLEKLIQQRDLYDAATEDVTALKEQHEADTHELAAIKQQHATATEELTALKEQCESAEKESADLREQHGKAAQEVASLKEQHEADTHELAAIKQQHATATEEMTALKEQCYLSMQEVKALSERLRDEEAQRVTEVDSLRQQLQEQKTQVVMEAQQVAALTKRLDGQREQNIVDKQHLKSVREQLEAQREQYEHDMLRYRDEWASEKRLALKELQDAQNAEMQQLVREHEEETRQQEILMSESQQAVEAQRELQVAAEEETRALQLRLEAVEQELAARAEKLSALGAEHRTLKTTKDNLAVQLEAELRHRAEVEAQAEAAREAAHVSACERVTNMEQECEKRCRELCEECDAKVACLKQEQEQQLLGLQTLLDEARLELEESRLSATHIQARGAELETEISCCQEKVCEFEELAMKKERDLEQLQQGTEEIRMKAEHQQAMFLKFERKLREKDEEHAQQLACVRKDNHTQVSLIKASMEEMEVMVQEKQEYANLLAVSKGRWIKVVAAGIILEFGHVLCSTDCSFTPIMQLLCLFIGMLYIERTAFMV